MGANFPMVDRATTLHTDKCVVLGVDDEAMGIEEGIGVRICKEGTELALISVARGEYKI